MTPEQFAELAQRGYNRIPLLRERLADFETPLSSYLKLAKGPYSYLLESVHGGETWGRYSIIGLPCRTVLKVTGQQISVERDGELLESHTASDPLAFVEEFQARYRVPELQNLPTFHGGLVGYFGYDTVRYVEPKLAAHDAPDILRTPDILLMVSDELVVFDNFSGTIKLIVHADPSDDTAYALAQQRLDALSEQLDGIAPRVANIELTAQHQTIQESDFTTELSQSQHAQAIARIKEYILDGDAMQVVLARRLSTPFSAEPLQFYRALRLLNPSPYLYFLDLAGFHVVGSSPEILARSEQGKVTVRPLAGTRRRGQTPEEDLALQQELLSDPKEIAEHLMLIDLGRNDVGRIADIGSVEVSDQMAVEYYSHVMHIVSNVCGTLRAGMSAIDVLRATLPAGTLSGAPKIRAMQIIDELEPTKRGVYGGAVGYISWQGDMDTAIAIRTAVIKDQRLYIQVGGGIVADSQPHLEWEETLNKARAIFRAAALAEQSAAPGQGAN